MWNYGLNMIHDFGRGTTGRWVGTGCQGSMVIGLAGVVGFKCALTRRSFGPPETL